jgi:hypothetical protein
MAIRRDLRDLPDPGAPDPEPRFAPVLAETWRDRSIAERELHVPSGKPFIHSDAGKCARALAYRAAGIPRSEEMDLPGYWNTTLGTMVHEAWQQSLVERFGDAVQYEVEVTIPEIDSVGYVDALVTTDHFVDDMEERTWVSSVEAKTIGGYGFKAAVGKIRRGTPPEGPKSDHKLQAAVNALAANADEAVVAYLAKECISYEDVPEAQRMCAEWTMTRAEFEPLARDEIARVRGILDLLEQGELAARKIPGVPGEVVNASTGEWRRFDKDEVLVDTGTCWQCRYCAWQSLCAQTPAGRVPVEQVVEIGKRSAA